MNFEDFDKSIPLENPWVPLRAVYLDMVAAGFTGPEAINMMMKMVLNPIRQEPSESEQKQYNKMHG